MIIHGIKDRSIQNIEWIGLQVFLLIVALNSCKVSYLNAQNEFKAKRIYDRLKKNILKRFVLCKTNNVNYKDTKDTLFLPLFVFQCQVDRFKKDVETRIILLRYFLLKL